MDPVSKLNILCYVKCLDDVSPYVVLTVSVLLIVMLIGLYSKALLKEKQLHMMFRLTSLLLLPC